jgi:L-aspartate oxidase
VKRLRKAMWEHAGLLRDEESLRKATAELMQSKAQIERIAHQAPPTRQLTEAKSLCAVADAILSSALARQESRGAHYRSDYPRHHNRFLKHSIFHTDEPVMFEDWSSGPVFRVSAPPPPPRPRPTEN